MKLKNLVAVLSAVIFLACNSTSEKETAGISGDTATANAEHSSAEEPGDLTLNNGQKWQADSNTHVHVNALRLSAGQFSKKKSPELSAYHFWAGELQSELNGLIKDCKMKGEDHEALHRWLEPVLENTNAIKRATAKETAKEAADKIILSLQQFDQYFK